MNDEGRDPLSVIAAVRAARGMPPVENVYGIDGFGPGDPPAPEFTREQLLGIADNPDGAPEQAPPVAAPEPVAQPPSVLEAYRARRPAPAAPEAALSVWDDKASFKGRDVVLTEADVTAVTAIVLRALAREVKAQLAEIGGLMPRQKRVAAEPVKRGPGRPRKERSGAS